MDLDARMKLYEKQWEHRLIPTLPALARIDGKCFHTFTKDMKRPFDEKFSNVMINTTFRMVEATNALLGYTQSDEISLLWHSENIESEIIFGGRVQKMASHLAALATSFFQFEKKKYFGDIPTQMPTFDARVWNVPDKTEAANYFVWRQQDATKNSISMAAREVYSHNELLNKHGAEMQEMLFQKGINWDNYPEVFKRGLFVQRLAVMTKFSTDEIASLPPHHEARRNPDLEISRKKTVARLFPVLTTVVDKVALIYGASEKLISDI